MKKEKKMLKKVFLSALCLLLIFSMVGVTGCKKDDGEDDGAETTVATTEYSLYEDNLPEMDYDGAEINVLCRNYADVADELHVDMDKLDTAVVELVYNRNLAVEKRMNIKINPILMADVADAGHAYWATLAQEIQTSVLAQDSSYDIVWMPFNSFAAIHGYYRDLNEVESIDLNKYYYSQNFNECFSIEDSQYCASGMAALSFYRYMYIYAYNNEMFEVYDIDPLFEKVKSGQWTMEMLYNITSNIYADSGNNTRDAADTYGFVSGARTSIDPYWVTLDMTFLDKDADNVYVMDIDLERLTNGVDQIIKQYFMSTGTYIVPTGKDNFDNADILDIFVHGRAAIAQMRMHSIEQNVVKNAKFEYSIVPMPKYDENQTEYYTHESDQMTAFGIVNNPDLSDDKLYMLGAFIEAMGSESYKSLYLQYFGEIMSYRFMQNPESVEMLDICYESVSVMSTFQASNLGSGDLVNLLRSTVASGYNNISSSIRSKETAINKDLEALVYYYINGKTLEP